MTRYRLSPPDGRHEDDPPIIAEPGEISPAVAKWLVAIDVAEPYSEEDELHGRLTGTFIRLSPSETASAILKLCPDIVGALLDKERLHEVLSTEGDRS